jgi:hypothetical protein
MSEYAKESVKAGKLVAMDTNGKSGAMCAVPVLITPSLHDFVNKSKIEEPAAMLLSSLKRTLESHKFTGHKPERVLKVYVSAKDNVYFESMTMPFDESEKPCIIFALPGQINLNEGYISEIPAKARRKFNNMTKEEHEEIRAKALAAAKMALEDPDAPADVKKAARELLSMDAARRRRQEERGE